MALTPAQHDLLDAARRAYASIDAVSAGLEQRITAVFIQYRGRQVTLADRQVMMREIDRVIDAIYGNTQAAATASELYRAIVSQDQVAAMVPYERVVREVMGIAAMDPALWDRIRALATPETPDRFLRAVAAVDGNPVAQRRILNARRLDPQRRWVKANTADGTGDDYRLSDRVWMQGKETRRAIDARIRQGIRNGEDALKIAKDLEQHLLPGEGSEIIRKDGKIVRRRNMTKAPGRGGWGNYPARRLARTEVTRVLGEATVMSAEDVIGVRGVGWTLSARHPEPDICDDHARADPDGLGKGVYKPRNVPRYPAHPMDLCVLSHVMEDRKTILDMLTREYAAGLPVNDTPDDLIPLAGQSIPPSQPAKPVDIRRPHGVGYTTPIDGSDAPEVAALKQTIQGLPNSPGVADLRFVGTQANDIIDRRTQVRRASPSEASRTVFQTRLDVTKELMAEVRGVNGGTRSVTSVKAPRSNKVAMETFDRVSDVFPEHWWAAGMDYADNTKLLMGRKDRAYFRDKVGTQAAEVHIPTAKYEFIPDHIESTAIHEMTHLMQRAVPMIQDLERAWYQTRTNGGSDPLTWMGPGYRSTEVTRKDTFLHPYIGKDYGRGGPIEAREVTTMGMQYALGDATMPLPRGLTARQADQDFIDFIIGMLFGL